VYDHSAVGKVPIPTVAIGITNSPGILHAIMMDVLGCTYIDDILIASSGSFDKHLAKLNVVLKQLKDTGFWANVQQCFFAKEKLKYLGYWLTH
jgi:hypothetical protein